MSSNIEPGRLTAENHDPIVVFLVGARINKWWLLPLSLPILSRMNAMVRELERDPRSGFLGLQQVGLSTSVQYWRSLEHLHAYANHPQREHRPAWVRFIKKLFRNAACGVWHETFVVQAGQYESIYVNMPRRGLGTFRPLHPAQGSLSTMTGRMASRASSATTTAISGLIDS